jgi:hypothetical protein
MRDNNFSLRLQRSLMEEARKAAASEGVSLNQLINVAVAEKVSALRTEIYLYERIRRADHEETLRILDRAVRGNPPMEGDKVLGGPDASPEAFSARVQPAPAVGQLPVLIAAVTSEMHAPVRTGEFSVTAQPAPPPDLERAGETSKPLGRATPQFVQLKRRLDKARGS